MSRRRILKTAAVLAACGIAGVRAQPGKATGKPVVVAQIIDSSPEQQDVAKDFLIGSRAAWQDINSKGGLRGRPVQHLAIEVDGTALGVRTALQPLRDNPSCVVLSGTASDPVATQLARQLREDKWSIAHAAPWLQNSSVEIDEHTFPIFAARQEQIGHALKSLSVMGVGEVGAVYATPVEYKLYREDLERITQALKIRLHAFPAVADLRQLGQRLTQNTPAILLFVGGTPELAQFTQGLEKQARQRYIVGLADVNLQTMMQMGATRSTAVIATQAVPVVTSSLPVVRAYRDTLARLFDEPPAPLSLAGFIAARYTYEVLHDVDGPLTRASALAAFQRRTELDVGGYRVSFAGRRSATYVTQSMLTTDGRVVG